MSSNIGDKIKEIKKYLDVKKDEVDSFLFDEKTKKKVNAEISVRIHKYLSEIFGNEEDITNKGLIDNDLFSYNDYSDAIAYSYYSYRGESDKYSKENSGDWRLNFFYKGLRWSKKKTLYNNFYYFYNLFNDVSKGLNPINFFVELGRQSGKDKLRIRLTFEDNKLICDSENFSMKIFKDKNNGIKTDKLIQLINEFKTILDYEETAFKRETEQNANYKIDFFKASFFEAREEFIRDKKEILNHWMESINLLKEDSFVKNSEEEYSVDDYEKMFSLAITLQYFDHPYDIHLYLPTEESVNVASRSLNNKTSHSFLIITTDIGKDLKNYDDRFNELINALSGQSQIEHKIIQNIEELLPTYWQFKDKFQNVLPKFEVLTSVASNILKSIKQQENIGFIYKKTRVKDFNSFFNKVIKIANLHKKEENKRKFCELEEKKTTSSLEQNEQFEYDKLIRSKEFYEIIKNAKINELNKIFKKLRDVAGLRVICLFQEDEEKFIKKLQELDKEEALINITSEDVYDSRGEEIKKVYNSKNEEIKVRELIILKKDPEDMKAKKGYRSTHFDIQLGNKRTAIYEFKDLVNLTFELQVRTLLADVWDNTSHQLIYKHGFPEEFEEYNEANIEELESLARIFKKHDNDIRNIKNNIDNTKEIWRKNY